MYKWKMYMEIQQLLNQGFSKAKVAEKLGISRTTVYLFYSGKWTMSYIV